MFSIVLPDSPLVQWKNPWKTKASGGCTAWAPKSSSAGPQEKPAVDGGSLDDRMMVGWWSGDGWMMVGWWLGDGWKTWILKPIQDPRSTLFLPPEIPSKILQKPFSSTELSVSTIFAQQQRPCWAGDPAVSPPPSAALLGAMGPDWKPFPAVLTGGCHEKLFEKHDMMAAGISTSPYYSLPILSWALVQICDLFDLFLDVAAENPKWTASRHLPADATALACVFKVSSSGRNFARSKSWKTSEAKRQSAFIAVIKAFRTLISITMVPSNTHKACGQRRASARGERVEPQLMASASSNCRPISCSSSTEMRQKSTEMLLKSCRSTSNCTTLAWLGQGSLHPDGTIGGSDLHGTSNAHVPEPANRFFAHEIIARSGNWCQTSVTSVGFKSQSEWPMTSSWDPQQLWQ